MRLPDFRRYSYDDVAKAFVVSSLVGVGLVVYSLIFGTADIEGSANTVYSAGADYASGRVFSGAREIGTHSVLGVPVYDTLQGTGDRLPYQASWAQSITWPLRFILGWEYYSLLRTLLFSVAAVFLCLRTLQSWLPNIRTWGMVVFGLLANASFGLHLRQNDWSDHYVQTIGTCGVAMFLLRRELVDSASDRRLGDVFPVICCLFVSLNGVVTGHPGFWPMSAFALLPLALTLGARKTYWVRMVSFIRPHTRVALVAAVASLVTVLAVVNDLRRELVGDSWQSGRLGRTQGLFSDFAFGALLNAQAGHFGIGVPESVRVVLSSVLATVSAPFFVAFDGILGQSFRASSFPEFVRLEFTGSLVLFGFAAYLWRRRMSPVRGLAAKVIGAQLVIWVYIIASVRDALPAVFAASGVWMIAQVLLVLNLFLSYLALAPIAGFGRGVRTIALANLGLIGVWCGIQFGFTTFDAPLTTPTRQHSWYEVAAAVSPSDLASHESTERQRIIITDLPRFGDLVGFVSIGIPVVAPADPKTRSSNQLQPNFSFNHSVNPPHFDDEEAEYVDKVLDFLQVGNVLVGSITTDGVTEDSRISNDFRRALTSWSLNDSLVIPRASFRVFAREKSSAFILREDAKVETCAVLFEQCPMVEQSAAREPIDWPRLTMCDGDCLWEYEAPAVGADELLVLPVTFDESLVVEDSKSQRVAMRDRGGFLAVGGDVARGAGTYTVGLDPDLRMWGRVVASYVNLLILVLFVLAALRFSPRRASSEYQSTIRSR